MFNSPTYSQPRNACHRLLRIGTIGLIAALAVVPRAWSQTPPTPDEPPVAAPTIELNPQQQLQAMLRWIDEELIGHVLYRPEDVAALRAHVESLAPASLDAFVQQTDAQRELMRSLEWQAANKFFWHYRTLDSVLTEEQQEQLAVGAATLSPQDIVRLMLSLIDQRARLMALHQASQYQNQLLVATRSSIVADQDRMRRYAMEQASIRNLRNYFPSHQAGAATRRTDYRVPGPLVTSREMARWVVFSGFFGRRF